MSVDDDGLIDGCYRSFKMVHSSKNSTNAVSTSLSVLHYDLTPFAKAPFIKGRAKHGDAFCYSSCFISSLAL